MECRAIVNRWQVVTLLLRYLFGPLAHRGLQWWLQRDGFVHTPNTSTTACVEPSGPSSIQLMNEHVYYTPHHCRPHLAASARQGALLQPPACPPVACSSLRADALPPPPNLPGKERHTTAGAIHSLLLPIRSAARELLGLALPPPATARQVR